MKGRMILILLIILAAFQPVSALSLSVTTSQSSTEITTGGSFTLSVQVSNSGSSSASGISVEVDLSQANGALSFSPTASELKKEESCGVISAGGSITKTFTIYGITAGTYTNQIKIVTKQNSQELSSYTTYASISVKDPAKFSLPVIITNTSVEYNDEFNITATTQNTGDYYVYNLTVTLTEDAVTLVEGNKTVTKAYLAPNEVFSYTWRVRAYPAHHTVYGVAGVLLTFSGDNVPPISTSTQISVANVPEEVTGGGGGGGAAAKPRIVLLANSIDLNLSSGFFGFLRNQGIDIVYVNASNFSDYKTEKFIVILGGPDAPEGVGEVVREVLNESEQAELRTPGAKKMYVKANVWRSYNQVVMVIAGSGRDQTREASEDNKQTVKVKVKGS
jgi:hypothetical protein